MVSSHIIYIFFLFSTVIAQGFSIKCFQCNSAQHPECAGLTKNDTNSIYYQECAVPRSSNSNPPAKMFCRKLRTEVVYVPNSIRILRSCGWIQEVNDTKLNEDDCKKENTDFINRMNCQCFTEGCNSSVTLSQINSLIFLSLSLLIYKHICYN